jgi:transcriptional regulator with XRE-family HTH domain
MGRETEQWALFAAELKAARLAAGWSREDLAARLNYSVSLVALVENMNRGPTPEFAERADKAFSSADRGTFVRLQRAARSPLPTWFRPWADVEAAATQLRLFEHSVVPGLLQTEEYARAVLATRPGVTEDDLAEMVAARVERQAILGRDKPPRLWVVIDEAVLHRQAGGAKIMADQLEHLADMAERPSVTIEVVPYSAGPHYALSGAFAIADTDETTRLAYVETVTEGYILESPAAVAEVVLIFDTERAETLSRGASRDLIRKRAEELWT